MKRARIIILSIFAIASFLLLISEPMPGAWDDNFLVYILSRFCAGVIFLYAGNTIVELKQKH